MSAGEASPHKATGSGMMPVLGMMLACSLMWATAFPLMKLIGADLSPMALNALRGIMGMLLIGVTLLNETVLPREMLGGAIVLAGILIVSWARRASR